MLHSVYSIGKNLVTNDFKFANPKTLERRLVGPNVRDKDTWKSLSLKEGTCQCCCQKKAISDDLYFLPGYSQVLAKKKRQLVLLCVECAEAIYVGWEEIKNKMRIKLPGDRNKSKNLYIFPELCIENSELNRLFSLANFVIIERENAKHTFLMYEQSSLTKELLYKLKLFWKFQKFESRYHKVITDREYMAILSTLLKERSLDIKPTLLKVAKARLFNGSTPLTRDMVLLECACSGGTRNQIESLKEIFGSLK